jgi:hypothetical protein
MEEEQLPHLSSAIEKTRLNTSNEQSSAQLGQSCLKNSFPTPRLR